MNPIADTGFKAAGDALMHIAAAATPQPADFKFTTGAYPNQLNQIVIRGKFALVQLAGAQGTFVGLDQVDVQIAASLAGSGQLTIALKVDGQSANPVTISAQ